MQMARTRLSPICWATSATMRMASPSSSISISMAWLISGRASGGNSTSTTGPAIATTRPSFSSVAGLSAVVVMVVLLWSAFGGAEREQLGLAPLDGVGEVVGLGGRRLPQRLGTAHDLHDLGGDRVLPGTVHDPGEVRDQLGRVVGGRAH